jgi:haloalkane dehalogenase
VSVYRTPDERFRDLPGFPFEPHYVEQEGLRMHYVDEGSGDPVLLLHGEPTWSFLYRKVIPALVPAARILAPDYFGFGRSDKPVERDWYTYDSHFASIERFVEELDLHDLTAVVHDWGGPIGLRLAVERPERVQRLVITQTGVFAGRPPSDEWLRFRDMVRRVGTGFQAGLLVRLASVTELSDDVVAAYDAPYPVRESKTGALMFPELVPTERNHPSAPKMLEVREALRSWDRPTLIVFSDSDPIFSPRVGERFAELIPGAEDAETLTGAGHFLQEDKGEELGERIARWLQTSAPSLRPLDRSVQTEHGQSPRS